MRYDRIRPWFDTFFVGFIASIAFGPLTEEWWTVIFVWGLCSFTVEYMDDKRAGRA